jgi:hypothetical protein
MSDPEPDGLPAPILRRLQFVVGALVMGVVSFAVVVMAIRMGGPPFNAPDVPVVSFMAVGFAAMMLVARAALVPAVAKAGRKKLLTMSPVTIKQLMEQYTARRIIGSTLLEGSAFFLLVTYLIEGRPWTLGGGLVMAGLLAVLQFPTRPRVEAAITADRQAIEDERALS